MISSQSSLALVTGAAHRVGRMIALELADLGYDIVLHYHSSGVKVDEAVAQIRARGRNVYPIQADLAQPEEIENLFQQVDALPGRLVVVVNSAAVMPEGSITTESTADWQRVIDLNVRAPWLITLAAARRMESGGLVVNICDEFAHQNWKRYALYGLSKSSLEHLTRMLAAEFAGTLRVNGLALGPVLPPDGTAEATWQRIISRSAHRRATSAALIGQALAYLLKNEYITGEIIHPADGTIGQNLGNQPI